MKPTYYILLILLISLLLGCNPDTEPTSHSYSSIERSKENNAFLAEYFASPSTLTIEGIDFTIKHAWVEHPHHWSGNDLIISEHTYDYVITFESKDKNEIDLNNYTKDLTGGNSEVWCFLPEKDFKSDTLVIKYKEHLNAKAEKKLCLIKRTTNSISNK